MPLCEKYQRQLLGLCGAILLLSAAGCRLTRHRLGPACNSCTRFPAVSGYTNGAGCFPPNPGNHTYLSCRRALHCARPGCGSRDTGPLGYAYPDANARTYPNTHRIAHADGYPSANADVYAGSDTNADTGAYSHTHCSASAYLNAATCAYGHSFAYRNAHTPSAPYGDHH